MRRNSNGERIYGPYKHGDRWRVHVVVTRSGGRRETVYKAYATRALAEAFIAGARDEVQGRTVRQAVDGYLEQLRARGRAPLTISSAEDRLWLLLGLPGNGERPLRWLLGREGELYAAAQVGKAADTHRNALSQGKAFGRFCQQQRWLRTAPFAEIEPVGRKRRGAEKPQLRVNEGKRLLEACLARTSEQSAIAVMATLLLGLRAHEVVGRDVRDVDDEARLLWVSSSKTDAGRRMLRVPETLQPLLLAVCGDRPGDAPLFLDSEGKRATRSWLAYHTRRLCSAAGIPVVNPHALRRTHATLATDAGATGSLVAAQLGHVSDAITQAAYIQPDVARAAKGERALRVLAGGLR